MKLTKPKHIVSFSGGKDSTAMLLRMLELKMPIDMILFADTTLEFPEMYKWIMQISKLIKKEITIVTATHSFDDWFYGIPTRGAAKERGDIRGLPLIAYPCWWSRDCKVIPLTKAIGKGNIVYIGIAKDEEHRAKAKMYVDKPNRYVFPLVDWKWTEQDCINYLSKKKLIHPLQSKFTRTGCWLCPKQNLKSLKNLYIHYPKLWKKLKKYEADSPQGFKPNFKLKNFEKRVKKELKDETNKTRNH